MASLQWIGKEAVVGHHREVPYHLLRGDPALSVGEDGGVGSGKDDMQSRLETVLARADR